MMSLHSSSRTLLALLLLLVSTSITAAAAAAADSSRSDALRDKLAALELWFEPNQGQGPAGADFVSRAGSRSIALSREGIVVRTRSAGPLSISWIGGAKHHRPRGAGLLPSRSHYFRGADPGNWRSAVSHYRRVRQRQVYDGVDVEYYGNERRLEFDFVVAPGSRPEQIRMAVSGAERTEINEVGDLLMVTATGEFRLHPPYAYQLHDGVERRVEASYRLLDDGLVGFELGEFSPDLELVIDPLLAYGTILAGDDDDGAKAVAVDADGNAYITGFAEFSEADEQFPSTPGSFQPEHSGEILADPGQQGEEDPELDAFILKLNPDGTEVVWAAFLGGQDRDVGNSIAIDSDGAVYFAGETVSSLFPTTREAFKTTLVGVGKDGFVAKVSPDGSELLYSTLLGGAGFDVINGVAVDSAGQAVVAGETASPGFPVTPDAPGPLGRGRREAFVTKLTTDGSDLVFSTLLSGTLDEAGYGVDLDAEGAIFVTGGTTSSNFPTTDGVFQPDLAGGQDAFLAKLPPDGSELLFSTFIGGGADDMARAVAVHADGVASIAGMTESDDLPVGDSAFDEDYNGQGDVLLATIAADGATANCTYLGGAGSDEGNAIAVDSSGALTVGGETESSDFPITEDALLSELRTAAGDGFIAQFSAAGELSSSTFYGSSNEDSVRGVAVDAEGGVYLVGVTDAENRPTRSLPTSVDAVRARVIDDLDAFAAKFAGAPQTPAFVTVSAASFAQEQTVAPDSLVSGFGESLAPQTESATSLPLPTELAGVSVLVIDSSGQERSAELIFVSGSQINYLIPAGTAEGAATVRVLLNGEVVAEGELTVARSSPSLFTANATGEGVAAASGVTARGDGSQVSFFAFTDAPPGQREPLPIDLGGEGDVTVLVLFGTGFRGASEATALVGGREVDVVFAGAQPEFRGLDQANLLLDRSLAGLGVVEIEFRADGALANTVTVAIR